MSSNIVRQILAKLPEPVTGRLRSARNAIRALPYHGNARWCPVCGKTFGRFRSAGLVLRRDAQCVRCGALERHRLVWLYLTRATDLFDGRDKRVLHVAPEPCLEPGLRRALGPGYLTADLSDPRAMRRMDITDIDFPDDSFDVIYCSHVLEHIEDDRKAMREFRRVLRPGGWVLLLVPVTVERTFEDPTIVSPSERLRLFGQEDHVRRYGPDFVDRLGAAGLTVRVIRVADLCGESEATCMGLTSACGDLYVGTKA